MLKLNEWAHDLIGEPLALRRIMRCMIPKSGYRFSDRIMLE